MSDIDSRDREIIASEQMRDRIVDVLHASAMQRRATSGAGRRKRRALLGIARKVRAIPGLPARIEPGQQS